MYRGMLECKGMKKRTDSLDWYPLSAVDPERSRLAYHKNG